MNIVYVFLFLIIIGFVLYFARDRLNPTISAVIVALVLLLVIVWLLAAFGFISLPAAFQVGHKTIVP